MEHNEKNKYKDFLQFLQNKSCNRKCADCDTLHPSWASVKLGIFLCQKCAGVHRGLGSANSQIKSVLINKWEIEEVRRMYCGGNDSYFARPQINFQEKYKNVKVFVEFINNKCEENKEKEPGSNFLNAMHRNEVFVSNTKVKSKKVLKMSEQCDFSSSENEEVFEDKREKEHSSENSVRNNDKYYFDEEPRLTNASVLPEQNKQLTAGYVNKNKLKKSITNKRSPFTFEKYSSEDLSDKLSEEDSD
ncbi:AGD15 [Ecytonucleospora hepatopenaei]|uniref:AGD15 n=1 Tax=Ecytonucleospora hepatopenaei TaxID=646526 RepID=A0A1W0E3E2_9MICR|nr:AGD15 [Ecytonucleospora hepatopenaei]